MKTHPVIDVDGHHLEFLPALDAYLEKRMGSEKFHRWIAKQKATASSLEDRIFSRKAKPGWWTGPPASETRDRAAAAFPGLLVTRLDELEIDFMILYTSVGLGSLVDPDDGVRVAFCEALNEFYAEHYFGFAERLTTAGVIPMFTPEEALAEIEHCYKLGYKVVQLSPGIPRPIPRVHAVDPSLYPTVYWLDTFGIDSEHNYDVVWQRLAELGLAATFHGHSAIAASAKASRSVTNYVFNHIGAHGSLMSEICKSLVIGGVTTRFPSLNFAFLEGGAHWACGLLNDFIEHWEKRNAVEIRKYDPRNVDIAAMKDLGRRWGGTLVSSPGCLDSGIFANRREGAKGDWAEPDQQDDFFACKISELNDIAKSFANLYFGCEADDRSVGLAFNPANELYLRLHAMFSSDYGHWDADQPGKLVSASRKMVDHGLMTAKDFRSFAADNVIALHGGNNPKFWKGTAVEKYAEKVLRGKK